MTSSRARRALSGVTVCAVLLVAAPPRASAQQVTLTLNNYGQPPQATQAPPGATPGAPPPGAYGRGNLSQALAYAQYLQYVQAMNYAASGGASASEVRQYFTNGAAVTTVPSAGQPGGAYFANGAEATSMRPAPATTAPVPQPQAVAPASQPAPYPYPYIQAPPQGPPPVISAPPAPPAPVDVSSAAAPVPGDVTEAQPASSPVAAMSFESWLASMGITPTADGQAADSQDAPASDTTVSEPSSMAASIRRASFAPREKPHRRVVESSGVDGLVASIGIAFASGLVLGGFAMMRLRVRRRDEETASAEPSLER